MAASEVTEEQVPVSQVQVQVSVVWDQTSEACSQVVGHVDLHRAACVSKDLRSFCVPFRPSHQASHQHPVGENLMVATVVELA